METHFNKLSPAEHERLSLLVEELAESIHIAGKILRHGYESYNPLVPSSMSNRELLETELGHVLFAVYLMSGVNRDIKTDALINSARCKSENVKEYLHHQGELDGW